ncbi:TetR/AcrR family transcriptional regulator [Oceanicella sp. SM1341]|uniref:TetR/AcrR family transcriptional regulator n=1 Tax=Oceanicella sp. SM1341 TaxID=1548889 RepID=UPI000E536996|nr:TetR/AcrR family transcriptional regulator [Oceanicella sp. SM1341]
MADQHDASPVTKPCAGAEAGAPRRRGRPKVTPDPELAARIVGEARALFLESGYGGTTMDEIAARCRVSKRTLYRLFPTKTELFRAIIEAHRPSMLALPGDYAGLPLERALERILRVGIDPEEDRERIAVLRLVVLEVQNAPELGEIVRDHGAEPSRRALAGWLADRQAEGELRALDPHMLAGMLMNMVFGVTKGGCVGPPGTEGWPEAEERDRHIRICIDLLLNGARPR